MSSLRIAVAGAAGLFLAGIAQASTPAVEAPAAPSSYSSGCVLDGTTGTSLAIEGSVGSGASTAYLLVDFGASGGQAYAWAYHFDGAKSDYDMVAAVNTAGQVNFDAPYDSYYASYYVNSITYPAHGETGSSGATMYWTQSTGTLAGGTVQWDYGNGLGTFALTDGSFEGWYQNDWTLLPPPNYAEVPVIAPEPASLGLLALGALALLRRRQV
jgi:hypothetical protein